MQTYHQGGDSGLQKKTQLFSADIASPDQQQLSFGSVPLHHAVEYRPMGLAHITHTLPLAHPHDPPAHDPYRQHNGGFIIGANLEHDQYIPNAHLLAWEYTMSPGVASGAFNRSVTYPEGFRNSASNIHPPQQGMDVPSMPFLGVLSFPEAWNDSQYSDVSSYAGGHGELVTGSLDAEGPMISPEHSIAPERNPYLGFSSSAERFGFDA